MHAEVSCLLIAVGYVGVLYAGAACAGAVAFHALTTARSAGSDYRLSRDDPAVIRRRCVLVALVCAVAWLPVWHTFPEDSPGRLAARLGLHAHGLPQACAAALVLCSSLFAAPLLLSCLDCAHGRSRRKPWDAARWRNLVVAPIAEEFAFRACMCPLLLNAGYSEARVVFCCPLFFGLAHVHHAWELHIIRGLPLRSAVLTAVCQGVYTSVFGAFATLLLLRTGTLAAPLLAHSFCNCQEFPQFARLLGHGAGMRLVLASGALAFVFALRRFIAATDTSPVFA